MQSRQDITLPWRSRRRRSTGRRASAGPRIWDNEDDIAAAVAAMHAIPLHCAEREAVAAAAPVGERSVQAGPPDLGGRSGAVAGATRAVQDVVRALAAQLRSKLGELLPAALRMSNRGHMESVIPAPVLMEVLLYKAGLLVSSRIAAAVLRRMLVAMDSAVLQDSGRRALERTTVSQRWMRGLLQSLGWRPPG